MAKGSEQMAWKLFDPALPHVCAVCDTELRVKDVGEHRTTWKDGRGTTVFLCAEHRHGRAATPQTSAAPVPSSCGLDTCGLGGRP